MKSVTTPSEKEPIYQKALDAYLRGELRPPPRAPVLRPESDYEQTLPEVGNKMMPIDPSQWFGDQIRVDVYRSGTSNAVRITHLPTGITTISQADVSQLQNRRIAGMMLLQALTVEAENSVDTATSQHQDI